LGITLMEILRVCIVIFLKARGLSPIKTMDGKFLIAPQKV
ncbi:hypothetical protein A2U01_0050490, partial [Trifolium medium]|nr:hypothetical protein [Trifolium medium]